MIGLSMLLNMAATGQLKCLAADGGTGDTTDSDTNLPTSAASGGQLHTFIQIILGVFAVVAVLMIIISAMNLMYAEGDPQKAAKALSSIIYALVGLVVAVSAEAIVTFVAGRF